MCCRQCDSEPRPRPRRRFRPIRLLFQLLLTYVLLLFGGGTLVHTGHPVAVETGRLIHTVLLVEPTIRLAHEHDHHYLANGLRLVAHGVDVQRMLFSPVSRDHHPGPSPPRRAVVLRSISFKASGYAFRV